MQSNGTKDGATTATHAHLARRESTSAASRFGDLLRTYRQARRLSQGALSSAAGCDQSLLSKLERGVRFPGPDLVEALCRALHLNRVQADELRLAAHAPPKLDIEPPSLTWLFGVRPVLRRIVYWFIAGSGVSLFFVGFLVVRLWVIQQHTVPLYSLVSPDRLGTYAFTILVLALVVTLVSVPLGFLVHQLYFALYWSVGIRSGRRPTDRAYAILRELEASYPIDLELTPPPEQDGPRLGRGLLLRSGEMRNVRRNWQLLRSVWRDALRRGRIEYVDELVGLKEDTHTLQGASMVAVVLALVLYALYEISTHWSDAWEGSLAYVVAFVPNVAIAAGALWALRTARGHTAEDATDTRRLFLHITYDTFGPPFSSAVLTEISEHSEGDPPGVN